MHITPNNANNWATRMAESTIRRYPLDTAYWHYEHGLVVKAIMEAGFYFQDENFLRFAKAWVDHFIKPDGSIDTYRKDEFNLDQIIPVRSFFTFTQKPVNNDIGKLSICCGNSFGSNHVPKQTVSGIKTSTHIKCGWMVSTWRDHSWPNMQRYFPGQWSSMKSLIKSR
jgi:hypothetical protein